MFTRNDIACLLNARGLLGDGVEIGVQRGAFSRIILENWRGNRLYSIDAWRRFNEGYHDVANVSQQQHNRRYRETVATLRRFGARSKILRMTSIAASERFEDGQLDFAYIDAAHHYEAVKSDILMWWPRVRMGGILGGHDYLDQITRFNNFGVKSAVDEWIADRGLTLLTTRELKWQSWLCKRQSDCGSSANLMN